MRTPSNARYPRPHCKTEGVRIDLHTHSTASDGTDTPAELVRHAAAAGLDVVAITDHDTTGGWAEAEAARPPGLTLVRGMEMSCTGMGEDGYPVPVHLLAYLFDPNASGCAANGWPGCARWPTRWRPTGCRSIPTR